MMHAQNQRRQRRATASAARKPVSRAIWNDVRRAKGVVNMALLKAILYELQPIDLMHSELNLIGFLKKVIRYIKSTYEFGRERIPLVLNFVKSRSQKEWALLVGAIVYWKIVVFLHKSLEAGPSVIIITILIGIFTVGLGDHDSSGNGNEGRLSAYSVFNRGFQNIMGGVDADALINQHVGGGFVVNNNRDDLNNADDDDDDDHDQDRGNRARRQQQAAHRQRQVQQRQRQQQEQQDDNDGNQTNRARKSNKKSRRKRNIELRREMQQQRDAALAMGFTGGDDVGAAGNGHVNLNLQQQDRIAMNRLVEQQIQEPPQEDNDRGD